MSRSRASKKGAKARKQASQTKKTKAQKVVIDFDKYKG